MDSERWERVAAVFGDALDREPTARRAFLDDACADDPTLRAQLEEMLVAHEADGLAIEHRLQSAVGPGASTPLANGTRLGNYRIDGLVGEGGMGEVYRAERVDGEYRQSVAIKLLRPGYLTAETLRRFRTERQVLARLEHPAIAAILDGGTAPDGRPFLVMHFVDGRPITSWCDEQRLSFEARLRLFRKVAEAVQYAHSRLVVHRDLKPSNILVQRDGTPRLLDFGIAKLLDRSDGDSPLLTTRPESRLFTPEHAAPEQLRGEAAGTATDVYGLGVLLFELLAGRRPFTTEGLTASQAERAIVEEPAPAPSTVAGRAADARALRGDLDRIVLMALRKEPDRRYASVHQLSEDIERYLDGLPVRAQRDTLWYRTRKFAARNRLVVGAATMAVVVVLTFSVITVVQSQAVALQRDRAEQERAAAEDVLDVLTRLFEQSNPRIVSGADTLRLTAFLDEAERQIDALTAQPERQARMWRALGNVQASRDQFARARDLLRRSWEQQRALYGADHPETARTYHELSMVVRRYEGDEVARPMIDTSLARLRRILGDTAPDVANAVQDLALATTDARPQRELLDSVALLQERQPVVDSIAVASLWSAQGGQRVLEGKFEEARLLFHDALGVLASRYPPEHPDRLAVTRNLAVAHMQLGEWSPAESLVTATLRMSRRSGAPGMGLAQDLTRLGSLAAHQGRLSEAESLYREALGTFRLVVAETHPLVDNALRNLGLAIAATGRVETGLAVLDSAVSRTVARAPRSADAGLVGGLRVPLLIQLGRIEEAREAAIESRRTVISTTAEGDIRRAETDFWLGLVHMSEGAATAAVERFAAANEVLLRLLPVPHPKRAMVTCAYGVALVRAGTEVEALSHVEPACTIHDGWGLADPLVKAWSRAVRSSRQSSRL